MTIIDDAILIRTSVTPGIISPKFEEKSRRTTLDYPMLLAKDILRDPKLFKTIIKFDEYIVKQDHRILNTYLKTQDLTSIARMREKAVDNPGLYNHDNLALTYCQEMLMHATTYHGATYTGKLEKRGIYFKYEEPDFKIEHFKGFNELLTTYILEKEMGFPLMTLPQVKEIIIYIDKLIDGNLMEAYFTADGQEVILALKEYFNSDAINAIEKIMDKLAEINKKRIVAMRRADSRITTNLLEEAEELYKEFQTVTTSLESGNASSPKRTRR